MIWAVRTKNFAIYILGILPRALAIWQIVEFSQIFCIVIKF